VLPEKYFVDARHDVVVTYSSSLALIYFANDEHGLGFAEIRADPSRAALYDALVAHKGIGLVATRDGDRVLVAGGTGRAWIRDAAIVRTEGESPLNLYGSETPVLRAIESLVRQPNAGDLVLFGAYDGYEIVSFDDQVGAHGSAGGDQVYPFIMSPPGLDLATETLEDARDIHRAVMSRYALPRNRRPDGIERRKDAASL
jgi:hypothetical protein